MLNSFLYQQLELLLEHFSQGIRREQPRTSQRSTETGEIERLVKGVNDWPIKLPAMRVESHKYP